MKITCSVSEFAHIGYVYLQAQESEGNPINNDLLELINEDEIIIPVIKDIAVGDYLEKLELTSFTFWDGYENKHFDTEYGVDFDKDKYIVGFEQSLSPDKFYELIKTNSYKLIETTLRNQRYHMFTMEQEKEICSPHNVLCSINNNMDAFVIIEFKNPSDLNTYYINGRIQKIAWIKALVSRNENKYPLPYLSKPEFIIYKDTPL